MTDRKIMQMALDALEEITGWQSLAPGYVMEEADEAKNFLRERLARPEQEPVAWNGECVLGHCGSPSGCDDSGCCRAAPPKREWVGLTDDDLVMCESEEDVKFVRAIEAKLKEKNGVRDA